MNRRLAKARAEHEQYLYRLGVRGTGGKRSIHSIPNYRQNSSQVISSNAVPENGTARSAVKYTGNEIAGIVTTHKSNLMPIRRDNPQAAVDAASMRR
ncbi:MAG TPA: hypothetical protein DCM04_07420 [Saprospirales bacterium]|nr:hypothetical protein [Saprospirales bacterium]|tara:strand:+ start:1660 stop:1950 length:291 start_codon:yes stop_codon:yes gene_type:complete